MPNPRNRNGKTQKEEKRKEVFSWGAKSPEERENIPKSTPEFPICVSLLSHSHTHTQTEIPARDDRCPPSQKRDRKCAKSALEEKALAY
jgi:hypothetical protein